MSDDPTPDEPESPAADESEWQRKQRLAAVFGDVLPDTTSDERDADATPEADDDAQDQWLRRQVPPHHG
jgi:hypothetical protein